jgi:hypothetical protein
VDNAWEQEKPESRKMLESAAESHTSGALFVILPFLFTRLSAVIIFTQHFAIFSGCFTAFMPGRNMVCFHPSLRFQNALCKPGKFLFAFRMILVFDFC